MALRNKIFQACESLLRVPPLLVVDEIFRYNFGLGQDKWIESESNSLLTGENSRIPVISLPNDKLSPSITSSILSYISIGSLVVNDSSNSFNSQTNTTLSPWDTPHILKLDFGEWNTMDSGIGELLKLFKFLAFLQLFAAALVVFVLSTKNLVKLYSYILAFLSIYLGYYLNPLPLTDLSLENTPTLLLNLSIRGTLAGFYFLTRSWPGGYSKQIFDNSTLGDYFLGVLDSLMFSVFFISGIVRVQGIIYVFIVLFLQASLWSSIPQLVRLLKSSWEDTKRTRNEFGISHLIQVESGRLRINAVFRLFWISRALYNAFYQLPHQSFHHILRHVMTNGSETLPGIIGLTVTVSALAHHVGAFLQWILYHGTNSDSDVNRFGSISTVLFFILCLQTGLTSLDPEKRLDRLFKNMILLITALFHALHQMVAPLLHAFRQFQTLQIRAAILSIIFLFVSIWSSIIILRSSIVSTWSVAVLALALEFKIKIIVSLLISVFVYFSQLVQTPDFFVKIGNFLREIIPQGIMKFFNQIHDRIGHDDIVFYLKSFSHSAEFFTGIFLFVNAIWIFLFESATAIRAIGMGIHAYFNIWCEGKKGWKIYCQRRTASKKIESLADANEEQLATKRDDVCAICYEEMESAKVTLCGHLFHAVCLRKWLYVQNTCPLCHEILYAEKVVEASQHQHPPADDLPPIPIELEEEEIGILDNNRNQINNNRRHRPEIERDAGFLESDDSDWEEVNDFEVMVHIGINPPAESQRHRIQFMNPIQNGYSTDDEDEDEFHL